MTQNKKNCPELESNQKSQTLENNTLTENAETQRVQKSAHFLTEGTLSGDLQRLADVWDDLPEHIQKTILTIANLK